MEKQAVLDRLKKSKGILKEQFGINKIAVFGSYARNEAKKDSDIDIVILDMDKKNAFTLIKTKYFLENVLELNVDIGHYDSIRPIIKKRIEKELLYV